MSNVMDKKDYIHNLNIFLHFKCISGLLVDALFVCLMSRREFSSIRFFESVYTVYESDIVHEVVSCVVCIL